LVVVVGVLVSLVVVGGDVYVEDGSSAGRERCSILIVEAESDGQLKIEGLMRSYW
jgi:hypothetical protein